MNRSLKRIAPILGIALLGGCVHERHAEIPADAVIMSEGTGMVSARAPHDGIVYVYDANSDKLVYQGDVKRDELVSVDPDQNRIRLEGRTASETDLDGAHRFKIFFDEDEMHRARSANYRVEETTVEKRRY